MELGWIKINTLVGYKRRGSDPIKITSYGYDGFVSIEVGKQESVVELEKMMKYVEEIFG